MSAALRDRRRPARSPRLPFDALIVAYRDAVIAGAQAEHDGAAHDTNPETPGTDASHAWAAGWFTAREGRTET